MGTLYDYLDWRGDISFEAVGIGEIDNLIFAQISYVDFRKMVPASPSARPVPLLTAARRYLNAHKEAGDAANLGVIMPPDIIKIMIKAAKSPRFSATQLVGYVNKVSDNEQKQFSAVTFLIGEDTCFISFRGTDDTIVGWKESFNMSVMSPIPAQEEAVLYVESIAAAFPERRIYLGGHSKGGNLAVWSAVKCSPDTNARIETVYSNDGPGFDTEFISSEEYARTRERIHTLVPQSSIIGMLLEHEENYEVVQSNYSGLFQHNCFSWEVMGGRLIHLDTVTEESRRIDSTLKEWLSEMSVEERKEILDSIYEILSSTHAKTLTDLSADKLSLIKVWNGMDSRSRKMVKRFISLLTKSGKKKKVKTVEEMPAEIAEKNE